MNFYDILEVHPTASKEEIKKAYHRLAIRYHPDKNKEDGANEKFIDIKNAYDVLSDDQRRMEYDLLSNEQKLQLYDLLKTCFRRFAPNYFEMYDRLVKDVIIDEQELRDDVNNLQFSKVYQKIIGKISEHDLIHHFMPKTKEEIKLNKEDLNIEGVIKCTLKDKYLNKLKKITVHRSSTKESSEYLIPVIEDEVVLSEEGECYGDQKGDLIIKVFCEQDNNFFLINENDLVCLLDITLYQFLYGGVIEFTHLDGEQIKCEFESLIEKVPMITLSNKGLPILDEDDKIVDRGKLFVHFKIDKLEQLKDKVKQICQTDQKIDS